MDLLSVHNLSKRFGGNQAVFKCDFGATAGQVTALIGPNGAGKTTIFQLICGLIPADEGTVILSGNDLTNLPAHRRARFGLSRTFQSTRLFYNMTVGDHLLAAIDQDDDSFWQGVFRPINRQFEILARATLGRVGLLKEMETPVRELSYGEQKLLDLAKALIKPHQILLLDEPVAGLNPRLRQTLKNILRQLVEEGETILLIEHDMDFVRFVADRVIVLDQGQILLTGTPVKALSDHRVLDAYLGPKGPSD